jgi:hypothetical protein
MPGYYLVKKYYVPEPVWLRTPHWNPVKYDTWQEVRDAYINARLSNVRALGVTGLSAQDIDIVFVNH